MIKAGDLERYHFRMTIGCDGATFELDADFTTDLLVIESYRGEKHRVDIIMGSAQREDLRNAVCRTGTAGWRKKFSTRQEVPKLQSMVHSKCRSRSIYTIIDADHNPYEFTMYLLSVAQYLGLPDEEVDFWVDEVNMAHGATPIPLPMPF